MVITKRIEQFIKEVADIATTESDLKYDECISEYTDQITNDDYYYVVNYANSKHIEIPKALQKMIDPAY